ncbi:MAG: hypothetical protein DHS20C16_30510 [Phycisphaerae bacterium]|nr:MAG: hypothetical protein DHS20C16_30510 [Phycisphaerae bacterium]
MNVTLEHRSLTVEEVFASLKQRHDLLIESEEIDPFKLTLETKIKDWFIFSEDFARTWVFNATLINDWFNIDVPLAEWKTVLRPSNNSTLADICSFVAGHARVTRIPEPCILGRPCRTAGAFLMIRELMSKAGVNTEELRPSSLISHYRTSGLPEIISKIIQISPELRRRTSYWSRSDWLHRIAGAILFMATIPLVLAGIHANFLILAIGLLCFASFLYVWCKSEQYVDTIYWVEIENVESFRGLCNLLARTG